MNLLQSLIELIDSVFLTYLRLVHLLTLFNEMLSLIQQCSVFFDVHGSAHNFSDQTEIGFKETQNPTPQNTKTEKSERRRNQNLYGRQRKMNETKRSKNYYYTRRKEISKTKTFLPITSLLLIDLFGSRNLEKVANNHSMGKMKDNIKGKLLVCDINREGRPCSIESAGIGIKNHCESEGNNIRKCKIHGELLSGYLADSEGKSLLPGAAVVRRRLKFPHTRPKTCTLEAKWRMNSYRLKRRQRKADFALHSGNDNWMQRLYSNTPFSTSFVCKITSSNDYDVIIDQALERQQTRQKLHDELIIEQRRAVTSPRPCNGSESGFSDDQSDDLDELHSEEAGVTALVNIVSGLLKESHEVQEVYKSYSSYIPPGIKVAEGT